MEVPELIQGGQQERLSYSIGRWSDNELILFMEDRKASWILYPPRSAYEFVDKRRASRDIALVEYHPWQPFTLSVEHPVQPRRGCLLHGLDCEAQWAIQAAVETGFDPFR